MVSDSVSSLPASSSDHALQVGNPLIEGTGRSAIPDIDNGEHNPTIHLQPKREGYLSWDDYFLSVAILSSKRSKDPISASGACIVDQKNRIVGTFISSVGIDSCGKVSD